jgi:hypothetical protein
MEMQVFVLSATAELPDAHLQQQQSKCHHPTDMQVFVLAATAICQDAHLQLQIRM